MEVKLALFVHLVEAIITVTVKKQIFRLAVGVGHFLEWVIRIHIPASKNIYEIMDKEAETAPGLLESRCLAEVPIES